MINLNIYRQELRRNRTSALVWSISVGALILMGMAFYPVLMQGDMIKQLSALFENPFMKNIMSAFGASLDVMSNVLGFYAVRNASFIMLLGCMFSILLAARILSEEEREKTAEFLLTKPVTRIEVLASKQAAYLTYLLMLNGTIVAVAFVSLEIFKGDSEYRIFSFLTHSFYAFLLMLTFGAIGLFVSLLIRRGRSTTSLSIGIVVGGFFFDALSKVTPSADKFGYISPFKFVDSVVLRPDYGLTWWRVLYFLGLSFILFAAAFLIYRKKDILV
jgi:ABC-2 type transport system permease protein